MIFSPAQRGQGRRQGYHRQPADTAELILKAHPLRRTRVLAIARLVQHEQQWLGTDRQHHRGKLPLIRRLRRAPRHRLLSLLRFCAVVHAGTLLTTPI